MLKSNCCDTNIVAETDLCGACGEHCEPIKEETWGIIYNAFIERVVVLTKPDANGVVKITREDKTSDLLPASLIFDTEIEALKFLKTRLELLSKSVELRIKELEAL